MFVHCLIPAHIGSDGCADRSFRSLDAVEQNASTISARGQPTAVGRATPPRYVLHGAYGRNETHQSGQRNQSPVKRQMIRVVRPSEDGARNPLHRGQA